MNTQTVKRIAGAVLSLFLFIYLPGVYNQRPPAPPVLGSPCDAEHPQNCKVSVNRDHVNTI